MVCGVRGRLDRRDGYNLKVGKLAARFFGTRDMYIRVFVRTDARQTAEAVCTYCTSTGMGGMSAS